EVSRNRRLSRARLALLGVAALRAAAPRLPGGGPAAAAGHGRGNGPPPPAGDRNAEITEADRAAGDRTAASGRPVERRGHRHRARAAGRSAGDVGRRAAVMASPVTVDWRVTLKRRMGVLAAALACWVAGIEARLVYLQIFEHAD